MALLIYLKNSLPNVLSSEREFNIDMVWKYELVCFDCGNQKITLYFYDGSTSYYESTSFYGDSWKNMLFELRKKFKVN
jgi:hypothetical protein